MTIRFIIAIILFNLLTSKTSGQETSTLKGIVVAKGGGPLVGCNVLIKGTTIGTVTNLCGEFSLPVEQEEITILFHDMTYEDLRTFELRLKRKEILTDKIVFDIGNWKKQNKDCKQTVDKRLKRYRIR